MNAERSEMGVDQIVTLSLSKGHLILAAPFRGSGPQGRRGPKPFRHFVKAGTA